RARVGHGRVGLRLAARQKAAKPASSQAGDRPAAGQDADQRAPHRADTAVGEVLPDDTLTEGEPALSHEEYPRAGSEAEVLAAASRDESPPAGGQADAGAAGTQTTVTGKPARRWDLGAAPAIGSLWQRSIGRLGISRLWQPEPGARESASPGVRALALVTAMPVVLLVAWLVPGVVLLLAHRFLP